MQQTYVLLLAYGDHSLTDRLTIIHYAIVNTVHQSYYLFMTSLLNINCQKLIIQSKISMSINVQLDTGSSTLCHRCYKGELLSYDRHTHISYFNVEYRMQTAIIIVFIHTYIVYCMFIFHTITVVVPSADSSDVKSLCTCPITHQRKTLDFT